MSEVRQRRLDLGLTQAQLAAAIDRSRQWVARFENGHSATASLAVILDLADALDLDVELRERDGAVGARTSGRSRSRSPTGRAASIGRFFDAVIFNWLTAGTDTHAKNHSLPRAQDQTRQVDRRPLPALGDLSRPPARPGFADRAESRGVAGRAQTLAGELPDAMTDSVRSLGKGPGLASFGSRLVDGIGHRSKKLIKLWRKPVPPPDSGPARGQNHDPTGRFNRNRP